MYIPTDSTSVSVMDSCYERLKEDVLSFREKEKVVLPGDFNANFIIDVLMNHCGAEKPAHTVQGEEFMEPPLITSEVHTEWKTFRCFLSKSRKRTSKPN